MHQMKRREKEAMDKVSEKASEIYQLQLSLENEKEESERAYKLLKNKQLELGTKIQNLELNIGLISKLNTQLKTQITTLQEVEITGLNNRVSSL